MPECVALAPDKQITPPDFSSLEQPRTRWSASSVSTQGFRGNLLVFQICAMFVTVLKLFFSEPILGPPNVDFSRENEKTDIKNPVSTRHVATN